MSEDETPPSSRVGSNADLARRMDRIEQRHETLEAEVRVLSATVTRVEVNQNHAADLTKLRFDVLERGVTNIETTQKTFMARMEAIISGEIVLPQARAGNEMIADYRKWRESVDERLPAEDEVIEYREWRKGVDQFVTQGQLLGRLVTLLVGTNAIAIVAGLWALLH